MPDIVSRVVDLYPYRFGPQLQFLLLHRSENLMYEDDWRMIGGKIEPGESAVETAIRECQEEISCRPSLMWAVPSANIFYEWEEDRINVAPVFAAEIKSQPVLDREHDNFGWFKIDAAVSLVRFPEQKRLLQLIHDLLQNNDVPASSLVPVDRRTS